MPKNCAVSECWRHAGQLAADNRKVSFYKFPLNDRERLAYWLSNMKRENWVPSQYQYICSEHFTPDSFEWRWGTRYLKADAVPTIFSFLEQPKKRKAVTRSNGNKRKKKRLEAQNNVEAVQEKHTILVQSPGSTEAFTVLTMSTELTCSSEATASASITEFDKVIMPSVDQCDEPISEIITPSISSSPNVAVNSFDSLQVAKDGPSQTLLEEQSLFPFENVAAIETVQLVSTLASIETAGAVAIMPSVETLQFTPIQSCGEPESTFTSVELALPARAQPGIEALSSFQQEPPAKVLSPVAAPTFEDVTALAVGSVSPAFSSSQTSQLLTLATEPLKPVSTLEESVLPLPSALVMSIMPTPPVVHKHAARPPEPVIGAAETVLTTQSDTQEVQGEHSYHKNDLSIGQLEGIVASLQRKVKVIQQRERRNSARLKTMENLVDQLKKGKCYFREIESNGDDLLTDKCSGDESPRCCHSYL